MRVIVCECGTIVRGDTEQELLAEGHRHMAANHPQIAERITDGDLLALSQEEPDQQPARR